MAVQPESEQQTLPGLAASRPVPSRSETGLALAADLPIARLCVDVAPAHLDRLFDYTVPAALSADAQPGVRVKVRFGAQDVDGYVMERTATTDHTGNLVAIRKVVSPQPVLTPEVADLARRVADYYAGSLSDVLRLAVPPRLARVEKEPTARESRQAAAEAVAQVVAAPEAQTGAGEPDSTDDGETGTDGLETATPAPVATSTLTAWSVYRGGDAFLGRLQAGDSPRAVWTALPGQGRTGGWPAALAQAALATAAGGRGTVVVLPDAHDVDRLAQALVEAGVPGWSPQHAAEHPEVPCFVPLTADLGPTPRYRNFLAALRGEAQIVVGTRAAAFAPVADLGLVVCWDDVDAMHQERRAPYPHVREILALRAEQTGCGVLVGGLSRSIHAESLVRSGWARELVADRQTVRTETPRVEALTSVEVAREGPAGAARLPGASWQAITKGLLDGPVLVQVPRAGYLPVVACVRCRTAARCTTCNGPLALHGAHAVPQCTWCGALAGGWRCPECSATGLRSVRVGSDRTAEELGKAFPGATVRVSGARSAAGILSEVPDKPALVVSTPGAEPVAPSGYSVGVLLDAAVSTSHVGLYTDQEALHRWITAGALVRPSRLGGRLLLVGDAAPTPTNALVRWDPAGLAGRELDERAELRMPPAVRIASVTGDRHAVALFLSRVTLPDGGSVLGPVDLPEPTTAPQPDRAPTVGRSGRPPVTRAVQPGSGTARSRAGGGLEAEVRAILRVPVARGRDLARNLAAALAVASARREAGLITVVLDPKEML
ncbi:primosomal protein N' (replication factor Y) - superfamily II helicase [Sanguibacter keddieii DSM 10542]|uniref:Probable replication restart protein PriA n=1 Tax=Sanguibacter keddieii (strain ATCC 51767 / DSM 10542 / NCFB 3025 / ST-74) TaxID=446469 RepID=D1BH14_SANKS|nr:primosomal protein N' [Sanguibacter keddieii]ACZ21734.1 primosomal protein N' (replication factor Y) - superfamily II helicase [Sanguibacter keddieii DSM 10542]